MHCPSERRQRNALTSLWSTGTRTASLCGCGPPGQGQEPYRSQDAELIGRKIAETVTSSLPEPMELVFEAFARRGIFLAKKRYALWVFEPIGDGWKDKIKVRGMETVRRDWCGLTSKTLKTCLELVLKEGKVEEAVEHVRSVVLRLQNLDLSLDPSLLEDLTLTRRYTKSSGSYKNKQPHIQLVEKIRERGGTVPGVGDRVPFVIVQGKRGKKNKELFVNRAEDPVLCFGEEHAAGHRVLRGKADLAARAAHLRELWGHQGPALPGKGAEQSLQLLRGAKRAEAEVAV